MFVEVAKKGDIAPGGMKGFIVKRTEVTLCNEGGRYYAVSRRCGHMKARLEKGTLVGYILTCPWHYSRFDIHDGSVLSGPLRNYAREENRTKAEPSCLVHRMGRLMDRTLAAHIKTCNIKTFKVRVKGDSIEVDI